jgi:hypothetical protein
VITRHNISANDILTFNADPVFLKKVEGYRNEVREKGPDVQAQGPRPSRGVAHHLVAPHP